MSYDHNKKAGNQGDVVKHVALIAALDRILARHGSNEFRFTDTFSGYAYSPLIRGHEWEKGIKVLSDKDKLDRLAKENPHTALWSRWYLAGRPQLLGGTYPGSSLIASDVCCSRNKRVSLSLWDTSPKVVANLRETYSGQQGQQVFAKPAKHKHRAIRGADFIFIDPPGLRSTSHREYPSWDSIKMFLSSRSEHQSVLLWLPVKAVTSRNVNGELKRLSPPGEDAPSLAARNDAVEQLKFRSLRVRWATGGRTIGCHLIHRLPEDAAVSLKEAVERVVEIAGWQADLAVGLKAVI